MSLWTFLALFFALISMALGFFAWFPERLLFLHHRLTGRDAIRELDGAHYVFMRLTRRVCVVPMVVCLLIALCFTWTAVNDARMNEINERRDKERFEKIRRQGAGSIYSQAWQTSPGKTDLPGANKKP
jgi:hypothetical protein